MNLRTGSCRARLHSVGDALQEIGIGQWQVDGDGNVIQRPQPRFHLHGQDDARHEGSLFRLLVFVGVERQFDVVPIAVQRVVVDDDLNSLSSFRVLRGQYQRPRLECLKTLPLRLKRAGEQGILLQAGQRLPNFGAWRAWPQANA